MLKQVVQATNGNVVQEMSFLHNMIGQEYTKSNGRSLGKNRNRPFLNKKI
jgi:hypothetical protein